ncbi:unnamed protein product [Arabidopsis lyrata]|nr:unnamed protein product [Arabidopsis lyrata]CAH8280114.1 unnamed protein product [Arabidopsis lyrata]
MSLRAMVASVTRPTSFAPIIERTMTIVEESGGQYHVLLIIVDGQLWSHSRMVRIVRS